MTAQHDVAGRHGRLEKFKTLFSLGGFYRLKNAIPRRKIDTHAEIGI